MFTAAEFAKNGAAIISAYSKIGTSTKDLKNANAAMQILTMGTKDPTAAVTVLESLMQDLSDPDKQAKLSELGDALHMNLNVRDENGQFRDLTELMPQIVKAGSRLKELGKSDDIFVKIFSGVSARGIAAFNTYGDKLEGLLELGDYTGAVAEAAARNAQTLKSNITNLQTAFMAVANSGLDKPLSLLTSALNGMAKHPAILKAVFRTLIAGILGVTALRGLGMVVNLLNGFKNLKSGKLTIDQSAGSDVMPVFVTNMGGGMGAAGNTQEPALGGGKLMGSKLTVKQGAGIAGGAALAAAFTAIPAMIGELADIAKNKELNGKEKSKAQGGAVGEAVGKIGGAAAGALAGAAIGSIVPGFGTAIGAVIGGGIGMLGGWLGRKAGEKIGESLGKDEIPASAAVKEEIESVQQIPQVQPVAKLEGRAGIDMNFTLTDEGTRVSAKMRHNDTPFDLNTGRVVDARGAF